MARKPFLPPAVQALKESIDNGTFDAPTHQANEAPSESEIESVVTDAPTQAVVTDVAEPFAETAVTTATPADDGLRAAFDALTAEHDRLKHKHSVLQGKYNAELPEARDTIRELQADLIDLTRKASAQPAASSAPAATDADDEETLGPDAIKAIDRRAERIVKQHLEPVAKEAFKTAKERFHAAVAERVDWKAVEALDGFQDYMRESHPETGRPRGEHLVDAVRNGDAARTITIYTHALKDLGGTASASETTAQRAAPASLVKPLSERVAPSGASAASTTTPAQPRVYKQSDVKAFFDQWAIKKTKAMTPKDRSEWEAKERDITAAQNQGRIRTG